MLNRNQLIASLVGLIILAVMYVNYQNNLRPILMIVTSKPNIPSTSSWFSSSQLQESLRKNQPLNVDLGKLQTKNTAIAELRKSFFAASLTDIVIVLVLVILSADRWKKPQGATIDGQKEG